MCVCVLCTEIKSQRGGCRTWVSFSSHFTVRTVVLLSVLLVFFLLFTNPSGRDGVLSCSVALCGHMLSVSRSD